MPTIDEVIEVASFRAALRQYLRRSEKVAASHGLTPQRFLLLLLIKGAPDGSQRSTVTELTSRMQLAQHTVTELVSRAERVGLVRRRPSAEDARVFYVTLTAKGNRLLAASVGALENDRRALRKLVGRLGSTGDRRLGG